MPTDVYFPLSSPGDPRHLSEHHPYGPLPGGVFNTDLGIEIQSSQLSKYPLLAVVDGTVRLIPDPLSPVLVLGNVRGQAVQDLRSVVGESLVVFLYRNVDITSVADAEAVKRELARWQGSTQNKGKKTLAETRNRFLEGNFQVEVKAGDALGFVARTGESNPHLGFEVVYTPSGLVEEPGWLRLTELLDPANMATRRLDPTSFYHRVASGPTSTIRVKLPNSQTPHGLLPRLTKRILLEFRDEYDLPFQGIVNVADATSATDYILTAQDRGTIALPAPNSGDRTVSITNHVLTELPSGSSSSRTPTKLLSAPAHWSLQSIFMALVSSPEHWFAHNESQLPLFTEGNRVTPLVDGKAAFKEMVQAMQKIRGSTGKHFLRLAAWWLSDDFETIPGQAGSTFAKLTEDIARSGAEVHALVWKLPKASLVHYKRNRAAVDRVNKLKQGSKRKGFAIFDPANVGVGSHHQKFMIASSGNDLAVAFCGGVDINPNRLDTPFHTVNAPYHDLHAKVEGPAVADLNATFVQRWNFNPEVSPGGSLPRIDPSIAPATKSVGSQFVQVTRTYPWYCNYPFAPLGETGTLLTLRRAIQRARRFIYFEDQYVTPYAQGKADGSGDTLGILSDLLAALHRIEYLIIVLPNYAGQPNGRQFRYRFISVLEAEAKKPGVKAKVLVFYLRRDPRAPKLTGSQLEDVASEFDLMTQGMDPKIVPKLEHSGDSTHPEEIFLHSKVWLIDDVYAKIGSANVNRRSLTHDSEVDIHVIDGAITRGARRFARELRLQLWGEMLNARPDYLNIQLEDPSYALQFWLNPPGGAFIVPYNAAARGGSAKLDPATEAQIQVAWDQIVDPDGHVGGVCRRREVRHYGEGAPPEDFEAEPGLAAEVSSGCGERVPAHPGETDDGGFGKSLVHSTDQVIASGNLRSSTALLRHLVSKAYPRITTEILNERLFAAADLFDAFTSNKLPGLREYFNQFFEVVAFPNSSINNNLQSGDCCVRRGLGEGGLAHVFLLVTGEVFPARDLAFMGLRPESRGPGLYVEVIDAGPFPHCLEDTFARRLGDANGQLSHDSLIFRIRQGESPLTPARVGAFGEVMPEPAKVKHEEIRHRPHIQVVDDKDKPLTGARWAVHQNDAIFQGTLDREGWTGPIDRVEGRFDPAQTFRIHVEGYVCNIVSGAALLVHEPEVEYGGQFIDWNLADDADFRKRSDFWREYENARTLRRAPQDVDVFLFQQHDHVMRRPVKLLARHTRAVFQARPVAIRLGPIVRYVDTRRALIWLELETPGMVRVSYGKAINQRELPKTSEVPKLQSQSHTTSVRIGGRHYALVWLDALDADTAYQYTIALAPLPPSGPLPIAQADFTETMFSGVQTSLSQSYTNNALKTVSFSDSEWLFFRTATTRADAIRFAHGSCRKWPGDHDPKNSPFGPDMLEAFSGHLLARKNWSDWPQFFLHSGDQIYADDVGVLQGCALLRHRFAATLPGPGPTSKDDVTFGAWSGRFGFRYSVRATSPAKPSPDDVDPKYLRSFFDYRGHDRTLVDSVIDTALDARRLADVARKMADETRPLRYKLRVMNELLWRVPVSERDIPTIDKARGLRTRVAYAIKHRNRAYQLEYPSAGETEGMHAADYAEYAALYEQAWSQSATRRLLAHLPSFMIFDDHEVTDDWNADPDWLKIVHAKADPFHYWPTTMTDALCAYWVYQGWGNLAPEQWASDPRVQILKRCRKEGRDALPELRRLVFSRAVQSTAPGADASRKLDWHFELPTAGIPFLAVDLRTDRDVNGTGGMSAQRLRWLEDALMKSHSPVAFVVLPVPYLMPDPMLFAVRHPGFVGSLARERSTAAFKRGSDIEHPAGNPVWDQIKGLLAKLQQSSALKTLVIVSGDIHFSCNLDGQLPDSRKSPRLLQLVSSGLRQTISESKQGKLNTAYRGWLNMISRSQGVDEHRGVRITLGGLQGPGGKLSNFLFDTSVAVVDLKIVPAGPASNQTRVPLIVQTHLVRGAQGALVPYTFRHMTQPNGSAVMSLKDPGFAHPASPKDYPAQTGGIGVAKELEDDTAGEVDWSPEFETAEGFAEPQEFVDEAVSVGMQTETDGEDSSLEPGESITVDGQIVRTYVDAIAWYTTRRDILLEQKRAFVKENYLAPDNLDDLGSAADARVKMMRKLGSQPLSDENVVGMLGWLEAYLKVMFECDMNMEVIAADRFRATQAELKKLKEQAARLQPQLRDFQRSAFHNRSKSKLKEAAETFATVLDSVLVAEQWVNDAFTKFDDIRVLGTTLRTQKALHGSSRPWHELMRQTTNAKVSKLLSVANGLNKALAAWQLFDASLALLSGGKTSSDRASAGIALATTVASAGGTLLGASGFFSLYNNLYIGPMVGRILGQIDQLKDQISIGRNRPYIQLGYLDQVSWDIEPGGREMYEFMHGVMRTRLATDIKAIPAAVNKYFSKHQGEFDAGTPKRHGVDINYADFDNKRDWVFAFRDDIWGMLYGSMPVP